eukprot:gene36808-52609_t
MVERTALRVDVADAVTGAQLRFAAAPGGGVSCVYRLRGGAPAAVRRLR